jgi:hypothetical protein
MTARSKRTAKHPLVGRALHKVNEDYPHKSPYRWQYQAHILDVFPSGVGELVLIQFFSCWDGAPTNCALVPLAELIGDLSHKSWIIYATLDDMREAGDEMNRAAALDRRPRAIAVAPKTAEVPQAKPVQAV